MGGGGQELVVEGFGLPQTISKINEKWENGPETPFFSYFSIYFGRKFSWVHANWGIVDGGVACVCAKWRVFAHLCALLCVSVSFSCQNGLEKSANLRIILQKCAKALYAIPPLVIPPFACHRFFLTPGVGRDKNAERELSKCPMNPLSLFIASRIILFSEEIIKDPPKIVAFKTSIKLTSRGFCYLRQFFLPHEVFFFQKKTSKDS